MIHHQSGFTNSKILTRLSTIMLLTVCFVTADTVKAELVVVTIEAAGVQQSTLATNPGLYGATGVFVENFNGLATGANSNIAFAANNAIGNYNQGSIANANQYGGAGGTGKYLNGFFGSPSVLSLAAPQRYFGFWWSAGDAFNRLEFYNAGNLLRGYTTSDVIGYLGGDPAYNGNPNGGSNPAQPYAFLNFFADPTNQNVTFDQIRFINTNATSGFESDNHTIASGYTNTSGTPISAVPEPSSAALLGVAALGMYIRRRLGRKLLA